MSKLLKLQLVNARYRQTLQFNYTSEKLRHLSEPNLSFGDARRTTTGNALTDLYIYLFGTKIVETIDSAAAWQTVVTLCCAILFKVTKQPQKCRQNRLRKLAETAIHTELQTKPNKKQNILLFTPST